MCVTPPQVRLRHVSFPLCTCRSQGQRPGLTQDLFCAPKETWEGSDRVQEAPTGTWGLGDSLFMGHMAWRRGRGGAGQPCLLLPRQPHLLSADPGATLSLSLSLSTRPGSLSDLSRGPGPPPAPGHCVVPCPYSRRLWNCRAPAFTVLSHDAPQPSPTPRAPPADDSLLRLCRWRSGLFGGEKPDSGRARCGDPGDRNNPVSPASPGQVQSQSW